MGECEKGDKCSALELLEQQVGNLEEGQERECSCSKVYVKIYYNGE